MAQDRMNNSGADSPKADAAYQPPDIDAALSSAAAVTSKVRVVHGANHRYFDLQGKNVGMVRKSLREVFNIPGDAEARVNGKVVNDDFILEGSQMLEFTKDSGCKGVL